MRTFREEWKEFKIGVLPIGASIIQIEETRKAFYSGALALVSMLISDLSESEDATSEDIADFERLVREITTECESFTV